MKLENINSTEDLKSLDIEELNSLAEEIRSLIIDVTADSGGHLAPSLGVVELSIALHYVYNTPKDKLVWDVGHQSYAHKILTGRRKDFSKLRRKGGISGFPRRSESPHDSFGTGHSSTSISGALGMAAARDLSGEDYDVVAVIGDGSLTGGLAFEGLNNAGHLKKDMLVILNDNEMFISGVVGALGEYLARKLTLKPIHQIEDRLKSIFERLPHGNQLIRIARRSKVLLTPGMIFEELGFEYFGPVDGHDTAKLIDVLKNIKHIDGPKLLHVTTTKGKGYEPAEDNPECFHGTSSFCIETGDSLPASSGKNFQDVFGETLVELASEDDKVLAITAAMKSGTGLQQFAEEYPERFFDVGIAEQHAVTFAAGLATDGYKPVCAIYSTFLQRSYDQIIHDVALQNLPVIFALDRAGIVGEDGPTHHGVFDLSFLATCPNLTIAAPSDGRELKNMLYSALRWDGPVALRYPRGSAGEISKKACSFIRKGKGKILKRGDALTILAIGSMVTPSLKAAEILRKANIK
ncbi:MAG: 1-deoxy-D-xylulose-5-phosphate synthase, partial [Elusimicrobia bacterium]|nr:1-deoxy-D-xylulose-5-phosphate synthase [Elusimicrobiota bacterium]